MEDVQSLVKTTMEEIEKMISTKTVVGEPMTVGDSTLIPLISTGFAFGAGGGSGTGMAKQKGEGSGHGTGGGAGVKPIAVVIIDKEGTRVEPIMGSMATAMERVGEAVPRALEKFTERWRDKE
ncbi:MAG: GerW family sporulation protein [Chloroflexota bacterium]